MADRIFQPTLQDPDLRAAKHEQQAFVNKSDAIRTGGLTELIKDVGTQGVEAMRGYEVAKLEREQEEVIDQYMAPRRLASDVSALDTARAAATLGGAPEEEVAKLNSEFQNSLQKYQNAVKEGIMSPEEFATRTLTVTRDAVNRMPGLYNELTSHAQKVLGLSGIKSFVEADQKAIENAGKHQAEMQKMLDKRAFDLGINLNDPLKREKVAEYNGKMAFFDLFTKNETYTDQQKKAIINNPNMLNALFSGASTALTLTGNQLVADTATPTVQRLQLLDQTYGNKKRELVNSFGSNAGDKVVQDNLAILEQNYQMYRDIINGKTPAEVAKNTVEFRKAAEEARIGAPEAQAMLPFWNSMDDVSKNYFRQNPNAAFKTIDDVMNGRKITGINWNQPQETKTLIQFSKEAIRQAETNPTNLNKVLEAFHNTVFDDKLDPVERQKSMSTFVESMAVKDAHTNIVKVPPEIRSQSLSDVKVYLAGLAQGIKDKTTYPDNTPVVKPKDLLVTSMGESIIFSSPRNPAAAAKMNKYYGKELNNVIKSMANLTGHGDVKQMLSDKESGLLSAFQVMSGGTQQVSGGMITQQPVTGALTPNQTAVMEAGSQERAEYHVKLLKEELSRTKSPQAKAILQEELDRITK